MKRKLSKTTLIVLLASLILAPKRAFRKGVDFSPSHSRRVSETVGLLAGIGVDPRLDQQRDLPTELLLDPLVDFLVLKGLHVGTDLRVDRAHADRALPRPNRVI